MFYGCTSLTQAPALPATALADSCYSSMFYGCTSLTQAPALPATTLRNYCYSWMFEGCTSLTQAPALPATALADSCYSSMFYGCTSLTQAPALPATTLRNYCYSWMFEGCTSLTQAPALPATALADGCYSSMFSRCTSLKLSSTQTDKYTQEYRIPSSGDGVTTTDSLCDMFSYTGGTFTETPIINTTYCLSSDNMIVRETEITTLNGYVDSMINNAVPTPDTTLSIAGKSADAKATGDAIRALSEEIVTTSESKVSAHNTGTDTHSDIRLLISGLTDRLNALADSDDTTLDQLSEVVAYIKSNRDLISSITTDKVSVADIVDNLTTNVSNKPLSAAQGVVIETMIDALLNDKLDAAELTNAINTALAQAKASGEFDGADGKSAYQYAQEGGYTGTEAEFAERMAAEIPAVDSTLTVAGAAADAAAVGNRLNALSEEIENLQTSGLTTAQINALYGMFKVCAFIKDNVSAEYTAFKTAFGITDSGSGGETEVILTSISATYSGGDVAVGTAVTDLTGIVVTANYSDGSKRTVTGYTLSGTIAEGGNTITVTYEGMTTTFTVTGVAEEVTLSSISVTYSGGDVAVGTALSDLTGIVVTATYSDGSTATVTGYTLSGEIVKGDNTIIVTYNGKTATFTVTGTVENERVEHIVSGTFPATLTWSPLAFDVNPALAHYDGIGENSITYYDVEIDVESISSENAYVMVNISAGAFTRNARDYAGQTGTLKMTGEVWHPTMSDASQIMISCNKGTETDGQTAVITGVRIYER